MMGMNSSMMVGANGAGMMFFGWLLYIGVVLLLILGIVALWKYIQK